MCIPQVSAGMKGHNQSAWLKVGETENCKKSCIGEYCKVHLLRIRRQSTIPVPCRFSGKGVQSEIHLCQAYGRDKVYRKHKLLERDTRIRFNRVMADLCLVREEICYFTSTPI